MRATHQGIVFTFEDNLAAARSTTFTLQSDTLNRMSRVLALARVKVYGNIATVVGIPIRGTHS